VPIDETALDQLRRAYGERRRLDDFAMSRELIDEGDAVAETVERLAARFPNAPGRGRRTSGRRSLATLRACEVRDFDPVLAEREAKARLERVMDEVTLVRFSSDARLLILDIIDEGGVGDPDRIADVWLARRISTTAAHARRLPHVTSALLWQLENLERIENRGGSLALTALGRRTRALSTLSTRVDARKVPDSDR
jgi:hypothetical protein